MGKYLNEMFGIQLPNNGKAQAIIKNVEGAHIIPQPTEWFEGIVCVVDNGFFEATGYAFDELELNHFLMPHDKRHKTWLFVPNAKQFAK